MLKAAVQVHFLFVFSCYTVFPGRALSLRKEWLRKRSGDIIFYVERWYLIEMHEDVAIKTSAA